MSFPTCQECPFKPTLPSSYWQNLPLLSSKSQLACLLLREALLNGGLPELLSHKSRPQALCPSDTLPCPPDHGTSTTVLSSSLPALYLRWRPGGSKTSAGYMNGWRNEWMDDEFPSAFTCCSEIMRVAEICEECQLSMEECTCHNSVLEAEAWE